MAFIHTRRQLSEKVLLDIPNGMLGQVLVDFGNNPFLHVRMKGMPQFSKGARGRDDNDGLCLFSANKLLHGGGDMVGKPMLLQLMPVRLLHGRTPVRTSAFKGPAGTVAALVVGRWSFMRKNA